MQSHNKVSTEILGAGVSLSPPLSAVPLPIRYNEVVFEALEE